MTALALPAPKVVHLGGVLWRPGPAAELLRPGIEDIELPREYRKRLGKLFDHILMASGKSAYLAEKVKNEVLGAVASAPLLASRAAAVLVGQRLTPEVIDAAAQAAFQPAKPLDNTDLTLSYRKKMVRVHVARVLRHLAGLPDTL